MHNINILHPYTLNPWIYFGHGSKHFTKVEYVTNYCETYCYYTYFLYVFVKLAENVTSDNYRSHNFSFADKLHIKTSVLLKNDSVVPIVIAYGSMVGTRIMFRNRLTQNRLSLNLLNNYQTSLFINILYGDRSYLKGFKSPFSLKIWKHFISNLTNNSFHLHEFIMIQINTWKLT